MRSSSLALSVAAALVLAAGSAEARRHKAEDQPHEVRLDFDFGVANQANVSFFDALYLWTPSPLSTGDVAVPAVRRFVRHPTEFFFHAQREGSTLDTKSSAHLGGTVHLFDGIAYIRGQLGAELDDVRYDGTEGGYTTIPWGVELGGRPIPLLSIGAYVRGRPIVDSYRADAANSSEREGNEHEYGGTLSFATPEDRALASFAFGYHRADWNFRFFSPGEMDVYGWRGSAQLTWQTSPTFSWILRGAAAKETWDNQRAAQDVFFNVLPPFKRQVWSASADVGILYWHEQRYGFHATLGGAYDGEKPIVNGKERGYIRFGFGVVLRF